MGEICLDSMIITSAILDEDFKRLLIQNIRKDISYTTQVCRKECVGNLIEKLKIKREVAESKFKEFENEISLRYLEFKEEYYSEGTKLFSDILLLGLKIKKKSTLLKDCLNIITLLKNDIKIFFSNDEDLEKACKRLNIDIEFIRIADSSEKVVKDFFRQFKFQF
ncbi:hypothetical protein CMI42_00895 [Candidatus Pacearchaeota archaeon]|nr:hypothetical protein [Candidatus Pacearchaeota archaeon]|tara:strand:- start:1014 stop:1508 length:495 start_codon:yes stop_codon:yes gene_type:complete